MARAPVLAAAGVTAVLAACGGPQAQPGAGAWQFKVDTVEFEDGARQAAYLRVVGQEGPEGEPRGTSVILSFDCRPEQEGGTIMTEQALRQGSVEVRIAVDQGPAVELPGFAGTTPSGGQVALTTPLDSLFALLGSATRAIVEYADGAGSSRTVAEFPVAGLATYRERFLAACAARGS